MLQCMKNMTPDSLIEGVRDKLKETINFWRRWNISSSSILGMIHSGRVNVKLLSTHWQVVTRSF